MMTKIQKTNRHQSTTSGYCKLIIVPTDVKKQLKLHRCFQNIILQYIGVSYTYINVTTMRMCELIWEISGIIRTSDKQMNGRILPN